MHQHQPPWHKYEILFNLFLGGAVIVVIPIVSRVIIGGGHSFYLYFHMFTYSKYILWLTVASQVCECPTSKGQFTFETTDTVECKKAKARILSLSIISYCLDLCGLQRCNRIFIFITHLPKKCESKVDVTLECHVICIGLAKKHWYLLSVNMTHFFPVLYKYLFFCLVQFSQSVVSNSLWTHGLQHTRPPCPSPTPRVYSNSCPLSQWCHPTISSSVVPFSSCLQYFPASGSFQMSQVFTSDNQSIGTSALASVLPMNIQDWFPLGWTGWISL